MNAIFAPQAPVHLAGADSGGPYRVREIPSGSFIGTNWLSAGLALTHRRAHARLFRTAGAAHAHAALLEDLRPTMRFAVENTNGEVVPRDHAAIVEFYAEPSRAT